MKNRIISAAFILIIFVFGAATALKSVRGVVSDVREYGLDSDTPGRIESEIQDKIYKKYYWIDIHGLTQRALGRTVVDGSGSNVYKLKSGSITGLGKYISDEELADYADNVRLVRDSIPEDVDLIYVQLPYKIGSDEELPPGVSSPAASTEDGLVEQLRERDIETVDIRSLIREEGLDWPSLFYVTDHHWRPQTACWTADRISRYLADNHGYRYDASLYDEKNMKTETFKNLFLGSVGRRTGVFYAGIDDFELVTPAYETSFDFTSYPGDTVIHREGDFREALIDDGNLKKDYYHINNYAAYTGDSTKTTTTINHDPLNDKKILLVRDSYSCALQPFLSLSQKEITTIDLRYFKEDTVIDYINSHDFDTVIIAYSSTAFDTERFAFDEIVE